MRVLHVTAVLVVGGTEVQLRSLIQHSRHECEVLALFSLGPVGDLIRADGIPVDSLGMTGSTQLSALPRLWRLMRERRYDVVHAHNYHAQVYARPAARFAGIPVVVSTEHAIGEMTLGGGHRITPGMRALYLGTERFSDMTIAVSQAVRDRLLRWGVDERKLALIPNGVDLRRVAFDSAAGKQVRAEFGIGSDAYVLGVLGRLDANKQFDLVIEAAAPLLRPGVTLLVVGDGNERARLEETAARCGVAGHVVFAGERNDAGAMLSAMNLLVSSSREETFGLSVVEALANGLPVLYTTCPALDGVQVCRASRVPGTVTAIRDAIAAKVSAGSCPRAPEPAVGSEYDIAVTAGRVDALYEQLAARRSSGCRSAKRAASGNAHSVALAGASSLGGQVRSDSGARRGRLSGVASDQAGSARTPEVSIPRPGEVAAPPGVQP
jgi:glycosyltransferase involved in cell wall biosynthesis